jgi:cation transport regulator ChaC
VAVQGPIIAGHAMPVIYFAYGSNLSTAQMIDRVSSSRVVGPAELGGYEFAFNKKSEDPSTGRVSAKANVREAARSVVWGVCYELTQQQFDRLVEKEGGYDVIQLLPTDLRSGRAIAARTFVAKPSRLTTARPTAEYVETIVGGLLEHGAPEAYVSKVRNLGGYRGAPTVRGTADAGVQKCSGPRMEARRILKGFSAERLPPGVKLGAGTKEEWIRIRPRLAMSIESEQLDADAWKRALDFVKGRLYPRYIEPAFAVLAKGRRGQGFAALSLACIAVEFLQALFDGLVYRHLPAARREVFVNGGLGTPEDGSCRQPDSLHQPHEYSR